MYLLWYVMIGLVTGFIAHMVSAEPKPHLAVNLIFGTVGSFAGGWVVSLIGLVAVKATGTLLTAFFGAVLALWIVGGFYSLRGRMRRHNDKRAYSHDTRTSAGRTAPGHADDRTAV